MKWAPVAQAFFSKRRVQRRRFNRRSLAAEAESFFLAADFFLGDTDTSLFASSTTAGVERKCGFLRPPPLTRTLQSLAAPCKCHDYHNGSVVTSLRVPPEI